MGFMLSPAWAAPESATCAPRMSIRISSSPIFILFESCICRMLVGQPTPQNEFRVGDLDLLGKPVLVEHQQSVASEELQIASEAITTQ
jgi:hypothetical protein